MSTSLMSRGFTQFMCALGASTAVLGAASDLKADDGCRFFSGPSSAVAPATCASPVGLCTHGKLDGDFPAVYDFVAATLQSANDPNDPTEYEYTGHTVITTPDGLIYTNDNGVVHISGAATAPFATTILIASGTGRYADASGTFLDRGTSTLATGANTGQYIAQVCRAWN